MSDFFVRGLPAEFHEHIYRFAVYVFNSKDELIAAIDEHVDHYRLAMPLHHHRRPMGDWDVSRITDFSHVFDAQRNPNLAQFHFDVFDWDVSHGTNFNYMFRYCADFQADLSRWNVSNGGGFLRHVRRLPHL
jgi:surface protein